MKSFEIRKGHKKIYGIELPDGRVKCMVDCDLIPQVGMLVLFVTVEQAERLFSQSRGPIQEVLPDVAPALREVFICGVTPLEWARDVVGGAEAIREAWSAHKGNYEIDPEFLADVEAYFSGASIMAEPELI